MSYKEVMALLKQGELNQAYFMAKKDFDHDPDNEWDRNALVYVYIAYMKHNENNFTNWMKSLKQLLSLNFDVTTNEFMKAALESSFRRVTDSFVQKNNYDVFWQTFFDQVNTPEWLRKILISSLVSALFKQIKQGVAVETLINQMSYLKNNQDQWISRLINKVYKTIKDNPSKIISLVDSVGWNVYQNSHDGQSDYQAKTYNGQESPALIERIANKYAKAILPTTNSNGGTQFDEMRVKEFLPVLENLIKTNPEFKWLPYYHARLINALGRNAESVSEILPIVRSHGGDFWAWEKLGDFLSEDQDKFCCYCKGLLCKKEDKMLVALRTKVIDYFLEREEFAAAKWEVDRVVETKKSQGHKVPESINDYLAAGWYLDTDGSEYKGNQDLYKKYSVTADKIVYGDIEPQSMLVTYVNKDKRMVNFNLSGCRRGFFKCPDDFDIKNVCKEKTYTVKIVEKDNDIHEGAAEKFFTCISIRKTEDEDLINEYIKEFESALRKKSTQTFGFTADETFIPPDLISRFNLEKVASGINHNHWGYNDKEEATPATTYTLKGKKMLNWNRKKNQWGWQAIAITEVI